MIDVVDYGAGNTGSVLRCLERLEVSYQRVNENRLPTGENPLLCPGVGTFGAAMINLNSNGLAQRIRKMLQEGTPYLGICIGLQVLFDSSEEAPGVPGLGIIPGRVVQFRQGKVPQIGWNWIEALQPEWEEGYVYFVNSYFPQPAEPGCHLYQAEYQGVFTAAVRQGNVTAFQFHPEKSGWFGQQLMRRWLNDVNE